MSSTIPHIMRCLPCFELLVVSRTTLRPLTPFKAQQLLNPAGSGTLPTGIFVNKEISRLFISGHNQTWYRQKNYCLVITFVSLDVDRQSTKKQWKNIEKKKKQEKRTSTACWNLFRAAITDAKLGAAGKHFETLISLLASCSVDAGSIGQGCNNFNDIMYCLEQEHGLLNNFHPHCFLPIFRQLPIKQLLLEPQTKQFLSLPAKAAVHHALFQ